MARNLTYEELEQKVDELENKSVRCKEEEEVSGEGKNRFRDFLDNLGDLAYKADCSGNVTYANKMSEIVTGVALEDIVGKPFLPLFTKESQEAAINVYQRTLHGESPEYDLTFTNGRICHFKNEPLRDKKGEIQGVFGIARDITEQRHAEQALKSAYDELEKRVEERTTELAKANNQLKRKIEERKKAEEALRESEEKYRILFDNAADLIAVIDTAGNFLEINEKIEEEGGYSREEMIGKNVFTSGILTKSSTSRALFYLKQLLAGKKWPIFEIEGVRKDGGIVSYELRAVPIKKDDRIVAIQAILRNITDRKQAEETLRESEEKYRALAESISDPFFAMDKNLVYTYWNKASEKLTGISTTDAIGKSLLEIFPDNEESRAALEVYKEVLRTQQLQVFVIEYHLGGKRYFFEISAYPSKDGLSVFVKDITERKQAEKALKESEEKFKILAEQSPNMIFINQKGKVVYANKRCEEVMGYTREEFYSQDFRFLTLVSPEYRELIKESFSRHMNGNEVEPYEYALVTKEGKRIEAILTTKLIAYNGDKAILGTVTDITERKQAEIALQEKEELLERQAQHLEEVNTALKVLLDHREQEKKRLEENILANTRKLIIPYIEKLESSRLENKIQTYLSIIKSNLEELVSPFATTLSSRYLAFTPTEIQISNLIKEGKTSKEIANLLNVSPKAVAFHRSNIRRKLGLQNQKVNLRAYLQSLIS